MSPGKTSDVDDVPLRGAGELADDPGLEQPYELPRRDERRSPLGWIAAIVAALGLVGAGAWWWSRDGAEPAAEPTPAGEAPAAEAEAPAPEPAFVLPSLDQSDPLVRELVARLSSHPQLARWLVTDELVRRTARIVGNVAWGEDPRPHLPFLKPATPFRVDESTEATTIDPRSYQRYDLAVDVFDSIDTPGAAALYRKFRPLLAEAYTELGYPDTWVSALRTAVRVVLETPVVPERAQVVHQAVSYRYLDPELEGLPDAQKLLLRAGPRNAERFKAKVRELATAAGVSR
jgi:hypothetical protein